MRLDCTTAEKFHFNRGWVVYDQDNGGIVAHDERDESEFSWMRAAQNLADALTDIERTIHNTHPQRFMDSEDN